MSNVPSSVAFSRREETWTVNGEERSTGPDSELALVREELSSIKAAELKAALRYFGEWVGTSDMEVSITDVPLALFDPDYAGSNVGIEFVNGELVVSVRVWTDWPAEGQDEKLAVQRVAGLAEPFIRSQGAALLEVSADFAYSSDLDLVLHLRIATPSRGRTLLDLVEIAYDVDTLCTAFREGEIKRETVADLVRGGAAELLVGQPEGNWLDVKSEEYDLSSTSGKISLAQAVARFANAEDGGLIVIGAKAKKIPGGEEIRKITGVVPRQKDTNARYLRVLDRHLYPPVMGLRVDSVLTAEGRALICIDVPPQPEELKPFLVHGAITPDGGIEGSFISIVQRRGEGSIAITAPMIHASIAAGRALLRGHKTE